VIASTASILPWVIWSSVLLVGVLLTGLYCGLETGIYVLNKFRLELQADGGSPSARLLKRMLGRYNNLLAVLLIGTNLSTYAATFAVSAMFILLLGDGEHTEWYTIAATTPILFIFGESVPKNVFQRLAERLMHRLSWFLGVSSVLFNATGICPLVRSFSWLLMRMTPAVRRSTTGLGHEGLAAIVAEGRAAGVLTHSQTVMADRVMHIGRVSLGDVMVPLRAAVCAPQDVGRDQLLEIARDHNYSRLPLRGAKGEVTGILDLYQVLLENGDAPPVERAREPLVLKMDLPVNDALLRMQRTRNTMAIVCDQAGQHVGIATIKDLVEEIVGELEAW
jgi:magnesium and cobalt exporter, CNNM family